MTGCLHFGYILDLKFHSWSRRRSSYPWVETDKDSRRESLYFLTAFAVCPRKVKVGTQATKIYMDFSEGCQKKISYKTS